jgi:calcium/proton exchanger
MLGSILSNILLVLGCCFLVGGIRHREQSFNTTVASTMSSLMAVASASLIIPATLYAALSQSKQSAQDNILILSHGTSIILLIIYVMYLYFQLRSHADLFEESNDAENAEGGEGEEEEERLLNPVAATVALIVVTILVAICADYLVGSIDSIVEKTGMSKTFIGLVLIPIVGNAAEHVTAVVVAYKDKMDLAIGVAIGSSLQIALFVTPFLVILGWIMGIEMTLHFQTFETVAFFISGLVVTLLIQDGKSNYLEGGMCLGMYVFDLSFRGTRGRDLTDCFIGISFLPWHSMSTPTMSVRELVVSSATSSTKLRSTYLRNWKDPLCEYSSSRFSSLSATTDPTLGFSLIFVSAHVASWSLRCASRAYAPVSSSVFKNLKTHASIVSSQCKWSFTWTVHVLVYHISCASRPPPTGRLCHFLTFLSVLSKLWGRSVIVLI